MRIARVCVLLGAAVGAASFAMPVTPALADGYGYGSIKDAPPPPPPSRRTWYLKGTIGMKNPEVGSIWAEEFSSGDFTVIHKDIKSSALFGFGIGVEHSRWLRFDLTGEYRGKQLFVAHDRYHADCTGGPGPTCYVNTHQADLESWLGLANAYIDLGTWRGITPYVGGGVGFASITTMGYYDENFLNDGFAFAVKDRTTTNFAWALYAGLAYDVTPQLTLDFGYRYTDLGSVKTGAMTDYLGGDQGQGIEIRDITSHDLLFSARYRLDHPQPVYPAAFK